MKKTILTGALLGTVWLFACGQASEGYESTEPETHSDTELPSQDEIDRKAAEQINAGNAEAEYKKLLEEMESDG